jgi:anti-sigma factor RsiW
MSETPSLPPASDAELHAFVDGQLEPARLPAVLAHLQTDAEAAARVAQWQRQRLELRRLARAQELAPGMAEVPPALTAGVLRHAGRARRRSAGWRAVAAAGWLAVGLGAGVLGTRLADRPAGAPVTLAGRTADAAAPPAFVRDALAAHAVYVPERRHPVEVGADEEAHLVQWLGRRLGVPLKAPALQAQGFRLLGGRLLPGEGTPRAQFMYEDAQGRRLTLYLSLFRDGEGPAETAFRSTRDGTRETFYWVESRLGYALSAELPRAELSALATEVYRQLAP